MAEKQSQQNLVVKKTNHPLHDKLGNELKQIPGVILDTACGGNHALPLFCDEKKCAETEFCDVDALIVKDGKVKVIIEIEEADIKPNQICGKILTSALSKYYSYKNEKYYFDESVSFIQVVDTCKIKTGSKKANQWINLEKAIKEVLPIPRTKISNYRLFALNINTIFDEMITEINTFLK